MIDWRRFWATLLLAAFLGGGQPVAANTLPDARNLFSLGNFRAAALAGASLETAEGLALASRARLVRAAYLLPRDRAIAELDEAEALARRSLEMKPEQVEAALNLAIILGYRTRIDGYMESYFAGRAEKSKALITRAQTVDPDSAWARLVTGAWNTEVIVGAGPGMAKSLYEATPEKAVAAFEEAVAVDGGNPTARLEYAKALIKLYGEKGWPAARGHLEHALAVEPADRLAGLMQDQARALLAAIETGEPATVMSKLLEIDPFTGP